MNHGGDGEEWRKVDGWPYLVSNHGRVKSLNQHKKSTKRADGIMQLYASGRGYRFVVLNRDGEQKMVKVHHLVLRAFKGVCPDDKHEAHHRDGDKTNNHVDNLEWVTRSENQQHAVDAGLRTDVGEGNYHAVLSEGDVEDIWKRHHDGETQTALADEYGVNLSTVNDIIRKRTWRRVTERLE